MVLRFTGEVTQKVDSKGRMSIPADFRRVLESCDTSWESGQPITAKLIYGDHLDGALQVYGMSDYDKMAMDIAMMDEGDEKDMAMQLLISQSEDMTVDKDGRVVMPMRHREKLGLTEGDLVFRGRLNMFEIWNAETYETAIRAPMRERLRARGPGFNPLTLLKRT